MTEPLVRIAAIADIHVRVNDDLSPLIEVFATLQNDADILLIGGDLTDRGLVAEMETLANALEVATIPTFVVLGNHDRRGMRQTALRKVLRSAGAIVLAGTSAIATLTDGRTVGIAGVTGTGGGFAAEPEEFGPGARFTRAVMVRSRRESARLRKTLRELKEHNPDATVVLTHFSPTPSTLGEEPPLKYWMLGNALLGRTIDEFAPNLVIHGHAHLGNEIGKTDGGTPVRNVAQHVIQGLRVFEINEDGSVHEGELRPLASEKFAMTTVRESEI